MFRPQIQKTRILMGMAVLCMALVFWASNTTVIHTAAGFSEKKEAAKIMETSLRILKTDVKDRGFTIYKDIDPNLTGLIFKEDSPLRTGPGDLESKQTTLKPNFAALVVDHLVRAGVTAGDTIALGMTGSMPGGNIAALSACKAMGLHSVGISSVGASMWGATEPTYTWMDMENTLFTEGQIPAKSIAASIGGRGDCMRENGVFGGKTGRLLIKDSIKRNNVEFIDYIKPVSKNNLKKSITLRDSLYKQEGGSLATYAAYINVGGGAASIGVGGKEKLRKSGFISSEAVLKYDMRNSMVQRFALAGDPTIHILNISGLVNNVMPFGSEKIKTGEGRLFKEERYDLLVTFIAFLLSLGSVLAVGLYSHNQIRKRMQSYEPESVL